MINSLALAYIGTRASEAPKSILEEASGPPPKPAAGAVPPLTPPPTGSAPAERRGQCTARGAQRRADCGAEIRAAARGARTGADAEVTAGAGCKI